MVGSLAVIGCASTTNRQVLPEARPMGPAPEKVEAQPAEESEPRKLGPEGAEPAGGLAREAADRGERAAQPGASPDLSAGVNAGWPDEVDLGTGAILGSVGGRTIGVSELLFKLAMRDPALLRGLLDDVVLSRIVLLEAGALGLEPPALAIQRRVNRRLKAIEERARKAGAKNLDVFLRAQFGLEPETFLRVVNEDAVTDALAPLCVRAWLLASDRREVRAIVVEGQSDADEVMARLARGEAFEAVARELSVDASKEDGGRMSPLVRSESVMARMAFATEVGSWTGPAREGDLLMFLKVEAKPAILQGTWAEVGSAVEASLAALPVQDPEFWLWKEAMARRHGVDTQPFLDLIR